MASRANKRERRRDYIATFLCSTPVRTRTSVVEGFRRFWKAALYWGTSDRTSTRPFCEGQAFSQWNDDDGMMTTTTTPTDAACDVCATRPGTIRGGGVTRHDAEETHETTTGFFERDAVSFVTRQQKRRLSMRRDGGDGGGGGVRAAALETSDGGTMQHDVLPAELLAGGLSVWSEPCITSSAVGRELRARRGGGG